MRIRLALTVVALSCLGLLLAAAPAGAAIRPGASGPAVKKLQNRLVTLGYLPAGAADGTYGSATMHAVVAFQKQQGLGRDGVAGPQVFGALNGASRPKARYGGNGRHVEVDLTKQVAYLVVDGTVIRTLAISSGRAGLSTPQGRYSVYRKERMSWSVPYHSWMPYSSYFTGGYALHEYHDVPTYPASHGCVRIPEPFAAEVYGFADFGVGVDVYAS